MSNFICPQCNKSGKQGFWRTICEECVILNNRVSFERRQKRSQREIKIDPEKSIYVNQFRLAQRKYELREIADSSLSAVYLQREVEALGQRIKEQKIPIKHKVFGNERIAI